MRFTYIANRTKRNGLMQLVVIFVLLQCAIYVSSGPGELKEECSADGITECNDTSDIVGNGKIRFLLILFVSACNGEQERALFECYNSALINCMHSFSCPAYNC